MNENKAREIHNATDLRGYSHYQLRMADVWVKCFALRQLRQTLKAASTPRATREFILLMARCHYGSAETDEYLTAMGCYPEWLSEVEV